MDEKGNKFKDYQSKDLFPRLTDDLLIIILSMLSSNLKFLCQCMLVSKRFALLIPLISSGTLFIPHPQDRSRFEFFQDQVIYAFKALKSFRKIRSLHLEFIEEEFREFDHQWKVVFGSNTCTCACLAFKSITKLSAASASSSVNATAMDQVFRLIMYPYMWRNLFAVSQPTVESVVITYSKRKGKVCFKNSELPDGRTYTSILDVWNCWFEEGQATLKFIQVPELRLTKSGYLMKGVFLAISKVGENPAEDNKPDDMLNWNFGEEENVFGEALIMILRTPEDRMLACRHYVHGLYISSIIII